MIPDETKEREKTRRELAILRSHLEARFDEKDIPAGLIGDLHNFYFTTNRISNFIEDSLLKDTVDAKATLDDHIYTLKILIGEQLQITDDLLPALDKLSCRI